MVIFLEHLLKDFLFSELNSMLAQDSFRNANLSFSAPHRVADTILEMFHNRQIFKSPELVSTCSSVDVRACKCECLCLSKYTVHNIACMYSNSAYQQVRHKRSHDHDDNHFHFAAMRRKCGQVRNHKMCTNILYQRRITGGFSTQSWSPT